MNMGELKKLIIEGAVLKMKNNTEKLRQKNNENLKCEVNKYAKCQGLCTIEDCMKCHEAEQGCHEYWAIWCRDTKND